MVTLHKIQLTGQITETGELKIDDLPANLPPGQVQVTIEIPVSAEIPWEDRPWTDEEIRDMMMSTPKTGAEIVAAGHTGGWEDYGITDSVEWLEEQRRKRREQLGW